jgi:hypothetical protein
MTDGRTYCDTAVTELVHVGCLIYRQGGALEKLHAYEEKCTYAAVDAICPKRPGPWGVGA